MENPSWTQGFKTGDSWESRSDQNWAVKSGITPDADGHYLATTTGTSTWTHFVTKDADEPQITQEQRETFTTRLIANFATTSSAISTRFIVYVNAASANERGWYVSAKIAGHSNYSHVCSNILGYQIFVFVFLEQPVVISFSANANYSLNDAH